jgi:glycosyltransferase involved in cell wall biosynthesis
MRIARGVQNKVLEAMAMACPVLVSDKGLEGIAATDREEVLLAETADDYQEIITALLNDEYPLIGERARQCVVKGFSWQQNLPEVVLLLANEKQMPCYARDCPNV